MDLVIFLFSPSVISCYRCGCSVAALRVNQVHCLKLKKKELGEEEGYCEMNNDRAAAPEARQSSHEKRLASAVVKGKQGTFL